MTERNTRALACCAGHCGVCGAHVAGDDAVQVLNLHVFSPAASVTLQSSLCSDCPPTLATLSTTTAYLLERTLGWYRSRFSTWPGLRQVANA